MRSFVTIILASVLTFSGCIDEYEMTIPFDEPMLYVDALISSQESLSSITIGWSHATGNGCFYEDSFGKVWIPCEPDPSTGPQKVNGNLLITERPTGNIYEYAFSMADRKGFVIIQPQFKGVPGRTYVMDMDVTYNGTTEHYHAESRMLDTPSIDKISYEIRKGDIGKEDNFVPLISFSEPQNEKNFYLFQLCSGTSDGSIPIYCGNSRVWSYSVISDNFLPSDVEGLSIDDGATVAKYAQFYPHVYPGMGAIVKMYSVDRTTYEFYKSLLEQFSNDGGAYSPTPATPQGNISNNALGLFRALHESSAVVYL